MPKHILGAKKQGFSSLFWSARESVASFLSPLNSREKFVYAGLIIFAFTFIIGPRVRASIVDEGASFIVPAAECTSDGGWSQAELAAGIPSTISDIFPINIDTVSYTHLTLPTICSV